MRSAALLGPGKIVYISCNPVSLGRDLGVLKKLGYRAEECWICLLYTSFINDMDLDMTEAKDFYKEVGNEEKAKIFSDSIGVELERGKAIFLDLFLYTHGIAVLTATGKLTFDRNNIEKMLKNLLSAFIKQEKPDWKFFA